MLLIKEVERKSKGTHYPETEAFRCNATTFKTNMTGFLLKAEERKSELETSVDLYRFCEEVRQQTRTINCPVQSTWNIYKPFYFCNVFICETSYSARGNYWKTYKNNLLE